MLFNVLPGLREIRNPLIVGYVLGVAAWLIWFPSLPSSDTEFAGQYPALAIVSQDLGAVGVLAAVSLAAYLIGGITVRFAARVLQITGVPIEASGPIRQGSRRVISFTHGPGMDDLEQRLEELVGRHLEAISDEQIQERVIQRVTLPVGQSQMWFRVRKGRPPNQKTLAPHERARVDAKSGRIDDRILAKNTELFNEISRSRSEAELRAGLILSLPPLMLGILLNTDWSVALKIGIGLGFTLFLFLLFREALDLRDRARSIALRAVVDGVVTTPTIDLLILYADQESRAVREDTSSGSDGDGRSTPVPDHGDGKTAVGSA